MALDFGAGCAGGTAGVLVGFPLDTVKVRIQTQDPSKGGIKYTGTFQCFSSILKQEGSRALYRGMSSPLCGVAVINAICFGVYGNVHRRMQDPTTVRSITIAGMASGLVQAFVCSPIELIKTQMQVHGDGKGSLDTIRHIIKHSGVKGLTRGLGITVCRDVPAFGLYFSSYELFVRNRKENTAWLFAAGGLSGIVSWIFTYPQDVIKSRLQADEFGANAKYRGFFQCLKQSVVADGHKVLFRGIGSTIIRAFPVNAATMGVVTVIMKYYSEEEVSTYDVLSRLRLAESMHLQLPDPIEKYFQQRISEKMCYHHNVCTMATDGPSIVQIGQPDIAISPSRLYVENILFAMPTKYQHVDTLGVTVGTMRSDVSLSTIIRILERKIGQSKRRKRDNQEELLWTSEKAFTNKTCDFMIDTMSGAPYTVIKPEGSAETDEDEVLLKPTLLGKDPSRKESVTTDDLLQPSSLLKSNDANKIYGFYYIMS